MLKLRVFRCGSRLVLCRYLVIILELGVSEVFIYGLWIRLRWLVLCVSRLVVIMLCGLLVLV